MLGLGGRVADPPADGGRGHQRRHQTGNPGRLLVPLRMRSSVSEKRVYEKSRKNILNIFTCFSNLNIVKEMITRVLLINNIYTPVW